MPWWNRNGSGSTRPRRSPASLTRHEGITAAAVRYDLTNEADVAKLAKAHEKWQQDAWHYVDTVGEAKDAVRFMGNAFRRIRLYAAFQRDPDSEAIGAQDAVRPVTVADENADLPSGEVTEDLDPDDYLEQRWADEADRIVNGFSARDGGQGVLMERLGINLFVVGECLLLNREVPERRPTFGEDPATIPRVLDWEVRSVDEVRKDPQGKRDGFSGLMVVDAPDQKEGIPIEAAAYVERIWRKHGHWSGWADSNMRAAIGVLEELDLLATLARVSIRSRIMAGIVTFPDELDFAAADQPAGEGSGAGRKSVTLDREIAEAMISTTNAEDDPNTIAPLVLRGPAALLGPAAVRVIEFPRRYGEEERAQYEQAVTRLGRTIELPVERTTGMADLNHWTAWQVDDTTYEAYVEPVVDVGREALTYGLLRPMLAELGCPPEVLERLLVAADPSALVRRPDRGKTATEGHGLFALSDEAWRKANGFGEDDAPSDDELRRRLGVARSILTAELSAMLLEQSGILPPGTAAAITASKAAGQGPAPAGDAPADGEDPLPAEDQPDPAAPEAAAASAATRTAAAHSLSLADRVLRERLLAVFDASVTRAVERAGARLRTRAQRVTEARAAITAAGDVPNAEVGRVLGPAMVAAMASAEDLFGDAFDDLQGRFDQWTSDVQAHAVDTLEHTSGRTLSSVDRERLEEEQADRRRDAWAWLAGALLTLAGQRLAGQDPEDPAAGEFDPAVVVPPGLVREALAIAGGETVEHAAHGGLVTAAGQPPGGPATGQTIRLAFAEQGFPWSGYVWNYGMAPRQTAFAPHVSLSGQEFQTWTDPVLANSSGDWPYVAHFHPGDHWYCRCDFAPVIAEAIAAAASSPLED